MPMLCQKAFTLLELLVVMAIISILVSIAIPKFADYRRRAFDTRALSDLRNLAAAEELYYIENEKYFNCSNSQCELLPGVSKLSKGVVITMAQGATPDILTGEASHTTGTGKTFHWNSEEGGLVE
jgi:prepilin-type N-terminal cleavage/methylation domain-containing protein